MMKKTINANLVLGAIGGVAALTTYVFLIRPWHLRWGATDEEVNMTLPGDEFVANPELNATHAITIHASAADVWPWLVQMGQNRGGFYSYTWLENLVGCDMHNANRMLLGVKQRAEAKAGMQTDLRPKLHAA